VRVVVTRPPADEVELERRLEEAGHEVVSCPLIEIEPLGDGPVDLDGYDWVIVTSATGADELRRRARGRAKRVAAIGPATAAALGGADLVARVSTQEGLLAELPRPTGRVLFAGAEGARRLIVDELDADFVPLYRTRELRPKLPPHDLAVLASSSAARAYAAADSPAPAVVIGPRTARAASERGVTIAAEATTPEVTGLLKAVEEACSSRS
jgi:uroporphyrinogen-III synthase